MTFCYQRWVVAASVTSVLGCGDGPSLGLEVGGATWVTEPTVEFGRADESFAGFRRIDDMRTGGDGKLVYVVDGMAYRLTAWTSDGDLQFSVGGEGDGPGEFRTRPRAIHVTGQALRIVDRRRFVEFSPDGRHLATVAVPSAVSHLGFPLRPLALLRDGGILAYPGLDSSYRSGFWGDDPVDRLPVVHLSEMDGQWTVDTVAVLNVASEVLATGSPDNLPLTMFMTQPFGDFDQAVYRVQSQTVLVVRTSGMAPGQVDVTELSADGDTVWSRRLGFQPRPLPARDADRLRDALVEGLAARAVGQPAGVVRRAVADALYVPEHYPPVQGDVVLASTGELWMKTPEDAGADSLNVWYAVSVGEEMDAPVKRILLPDSFLPHDATETHLWGVRTDALNVTYVAGRRLIRQDQEEPEE